MNDKLSSEAPRPSKLLDQLRDRLRLKHHSIRTEVKYVQWAFLFIHFMTKDISWAWAAEVGAFLTDLAVSGKVAAATQNQALSALLIL